MYVHQSSIFDLMTDMCVHQSSIFDLMSDMYVHQSSIFYLGLSHHLFMRIHLPTSVQVYSLPFANTKMNVPRAQFHGAA